MCFVLDHTFVCPVIITTSFAGVGVGCTCVCEVTPFSTFHALHWFMLESAQIDSKATYSQSIPNANVSNIGVFQCKDGMSSPLLWGSPADRFYLSCLGNDTCWEFIAFFNLL